jgi:membrane protein DedA with SNARE-associated domain
MSEADRTAPATSRSGARVKAALFWLALALVLTAGAYGAAWLLQHDALLWLARANSWLADHLIARFGYAGVFGLMFIESSFIPFPSEIVMPPAGDLARRLPDWTLGGVIAAGIAGSLAGALLNYYLARYLGRALILRLIQRYGAWIRLSEGAYLKSEAFFLRHGAIATFTGRLIPAVRQLISLPAGLARMPLLPFCVLTSLGAGIWTALLAVLGYRFGQDAERLSQALKQDSGWLAAGAAALIAAYVMWQRLRRPRPPAQG